MKKSTAQSRKGVSMKKRGVNKEKKRHHYCRADQYVAEILA